MAQTAALSQAPTFARMPEIGQALTQEFLVLLLEAPDRDHDQHVDRDGDHAAAALEGAAADGRRGQNPCA